MLVVSRCDSYNYFKAGHPVCHMSASILVEAGVVLHFDTCAGAQQSLRKRVSSEDSNPPAHPSLR